MAQWSLESLYPIVSSTASIYFTIIYYRKTLEVMSGQFVSISIHVYVSVISAVFSKHINRHYSQTIQLLILIWVKVLKKWYLKLSYKTLGSTHLYLKTLKKYTYLGKSLRFASSTHGWHIVYPFFCQVIQCSILSPPCVSTLLE